MHGKWKKCFVKTEGSKKLALNCRINVNYTEKKEEYCIKIEWYKDIIQKESEKPKNIVANIQNWRKMTWEREKDAINTYMIEGKDQDDSYDGGSARSRSS